MDRQILRTILRYISERIAIDDDPCRFGKPLRHELQGLWRYRIGDYLAICRIETTSLSCWY
ncbi:MAG: hypothetical protein P8163_22860 [Candidatus Thiodiazotropha sp.]